MRERLDKILVDRGFAASRQRAKEMILSGKIKINDNVITNYKREFEDNSNIIAIEEDIPWVSRAALKLVRALEIFNVEVANRVALDIGSSTGGFTQVLIEKGAKHVYAIDVGTNQFHSKLKSIPNITLREGTHIKDVDISDFTLRPSLIVIDVSFISLEKIIPKAKELMTEHGDIIALIKPQFEVGKENIGKGVVKDPELHKQVCEKIISLSDSLGFKHEDVIESPIHGGDGNIEFLIHMYK